MKSVQVFGADSDKCRKFFINVEKVVSSMGNGYQVTRIVDINEWISNAILPTPILAIDGKVLSNGKVLTTHQIKALIEKSHGFPPVS